MTLGLITTTKPTPTTPRGPKDGTTPVASKAAEEVENSFTVRLLEPVGRLEVKLIIFTES
jgi:hypothetical protein